jgi:hypothetical protein
MDAMGSTAMSQTKSKKQVKAHSTTMATITAAAPSTTDGEYARHLSVNPCAQVAVGWASPMVIQVIAAISNSGGVTESEKKKLADARTIIQNYTSRFHVVDRSREHMIE